MGLLNIQSPLWHPPLVSKTQFGDIAETMKYDTIRSEVQTSGYCKSCTVDFIQQLVLVLYVLLEINVAKNEQN